MIGIRVDANAKVASGHIMRTISIAKELKKIGEEFVFISADEGTNPFLEGTGFEVVVLNSSWNHMYDELPILLPLLKERSITSLLVDSYYVTPEYMQELSKVTFVTYFDEMNLKGYGCKQLINGVLEPPAYTDPLQKAFTGPDYVSLREEFAGAYDRQVRDSLNTILVTSGGSDNYHFAKSFTEAFLEKEFFKNIKLTVILGSLCVDKEKLLAMYKENPRVTVYVNTNKMAELMKNCDYAVTAGGTTLYELCAMGLPGASYAVGDNQLEILDSFDKKGLISYAGDFRSDSVKVLDNLLEQIKEALPKEYREEKSRRMQKIVDGRGAERIAKLLKI